ncbi:MAG TPA: matrixin family metalloprotease [Blastocatellia bacterium]|nr:matrixin family metalloprotease [Blastocatellia bacterium]
MPTLRRRVLSLLGCLLVLALSQTALATTAVMPRDEDLVVESRAIIMGRVLGLSTAVDSNNRYVYTYVRLAVNTVLKGSILEQEIVVKELGGETVDHGTMIYGMPHFEIGQEVLLYLNTWPDGALRVHQGFLGKFNVNRDSSTGRVTVERQSAGENVHFMAGSGSVGTDSSELDAYTQLLGRLMETNQQRMLAFEQRFYSDTPMFARPVEFDSLRPDFTPMWVLLNPSNPSRWFEADSNQPVVFYVNSNGAPSFSPLQEDIQAAMNAWSRAGASIRVSYGGPTSGCGVQVADGSNTISFNNCDKYFVASQSCSGLLAVSGIVRYMPNQTKRIGGTTYAKAIEANMSFNPYALCNFTNRAQLQEIATHEMGHALGLGHSADSGATMAPYVHFDNRAAAIMADDIQGITSIYPGGSAGPSLNIMTSSLATANVDRDYTATLEASGGTGGYHWDLVSGQTPPGIALTMSGLLFGTSSAAGNFSFTAQVRDSAGNSSQRFFTLVVKPAGLPPSISQVQYKKKKVILYGDDFQDGAGVFVDGERLEVGGFDVTRLATVKRKQRPGMHEVYVLNPDGKRSSTVQFFVE